MNSEGSKRDPLRARARGGTTMPTESHGYPQGVRWVPLRDAALTLGISAEGLRKQLERRARRSSDGAVQAELDGVLGRKLAGRWRVLLSSAWLAPTVASLCQAREPRGPGDGP